MSNNSSKLKVAVLYGGRSEEHEISLQSAASVIKHLDQNLFEAIPIAIDHDGQWLLNDVKQLPIDNLTKSLILRTSNSQALAAPGQFIIKANNDVSSASKRFCDVVFPVLHGTFGEDGTMQGLLEIADMPYVGAGVLSSAIAMDKVMAKRLAVSAGISVDTYLTFNQGQWKNKSDYYAKWIMTQLGYPIFVKPANTGSSVGINKVKQPADLANAIDEAFQHDVKIIIEKALDVREIEVAVLESSEYGAEPLTSIPGEVIPHDEFYTYEAKYSEGGSDLLIPAPLSETQTCQAQQIAKEIFMALDCEGMARVDLFLDKQTGKFFFNEANTIPGFTQMSMYPKLWEATGISYQALLTHLIQLSVDRYKRKRNIKHEFIPQEADYS